MGVSKWEIARQITSIFSSFSAKQRKKILLLFLERRDFMLFLVT